MRRKMHKETTIPVINDDEYKSLVSRLKKDSLTAQDRELLIKVLYTLRTLFEKIATLKITIKQLRQMFHIKTEKASSLVPSSDQSDGDSPAEETGENRSEKQKPSSGKEKKRKGHGRIPAQSYEGADTCFYEHDTLHHGDRCPGCHRGNVYDDTGTGFIRFEGKAPLHATHHKQQQFRCGTCGKIFYAPLPEHVERYKKEKYSISAQSVIAVMKYGYGFPFHRLQKLQQSFKMPVPATTQWDCVVKLANKIYPVYFALYNRAAQGTVMYNDDTTARILNYPSPAITGHDKKRTGIFTTGLVSKVNNQEIVLYCTGRNHAGENLGNLLAQRHENRDPPIQMCDASSRNMPKEYDTLLSHCLIHGRRKFVEIITSFPDPCRTVIKKLGIVFHNEKICQREKMTPQERLFFHQAKSEPIMNELKRWMDEQIANKQVEPNSQLGKAISYMQTHWTELTQFHRVAGVPLDSNTVERSLKMVLLHRKNAYFFKTEHGALIGDLFMSLIETCRRAHTDPFIYLNTVAEHHESVRIHPENWLPWNYHLSVDHQKAA